MFLLKRKDLTGFFVRFLVLLMALLCSFLVATELSGNDANYLRACQVGFWVVLFCSIVGHIAGEFPKGDEFVLVRLTGSIGARSGLLLFFLLLTRRWDLSNHGFIYYILAFYAVGLVADVILTSIRTWQWSDNSQSSEIVAN